MIRHSASELMGTSTISFLTLRLNMYKRLVRLGWAAAVVCTYVSCAIFVKSRHFEDSGSSPENVEAVSRLVSYPSI